MSKTETGSAQSEVVYGGNSPTGDEQRSMSEKVSNMAASIYREFESMIAKHGEEGIKALMPLVVNVLESLDMAYLERDELSVDMEMLKEDNEQLVTQYEREKAQRKNVEQKYMEIEDNLIGQNKELESRIESLESIMRMLELKAKNANDHANRLEEREADQKADFDRLHERYNTLLRTHVDHMERTKYLMGNDKFELMQNMPLPQPQLRTRLGMAASVDANSIRGVSDLISAHMTQSTTMDVNLANHITEADWQDEFASSDVEPSPRDMIVEEQSDLEQPVPKQRTPVKEPSPVQPAAPVAVPIEPISEEREATEDDQLGADLTEDELDGVSSAHSNSYGFDDDFFFQQRREVQRQRLTNNRSRRQSTGSDTSDSGMGGMGKEVENLIKENTELLDMKNALNIVKNDLIARVDELSSENEILRDEVRSLEMVRMKMNEHVTKLEEDLKTTKQKLAEKEAEAEEEDVPMSQRKRFTRAEMQRVLIDRNMYKEKLMELEESVKWTEKQRARKLQAAAQQQQKKSPSIWDFFSNLLTQSPSPPQARRSGRPAADRGKGQMTRSVEYVDPDMISERRAAERREHYRLVREHVKKDDNGRMEMYGWSLPAVDPTQSTAIPVPVCCRPLMDNQPALKIWCAAGVMLRGGKSNDGKYIVGEHSYISSLKKGSTKAASGQLEDAISRARALDARESELSEWEYSSLVWVGSSNLGRSFVAVLDANNPNNIIDSFEACDSHLLCMHGVPGVMESDPIMAEAGVKQFLSGGGKIKDVPEGIDAIELGLCEWIDLRKMEDSEDGVPTYCSNDMKPSPKRARDFSVSDTAAVPTTSEGAEADMSLSATSPTVASKPLPSTELTKPVGRAALPKHVQDEMSRYDEVAGQMSTAQPTVWIGSQNQYIYVHSAVTAWRQCLRRIKMMDAVLSVVHFKGRVYAALANGSIAVFHRDKTGEWMDAGYHSIRLGKATSSVRYLCVVAGNIWAAYRNCVAVIDGESLQITKVFSAHSRKDAQVRNIQWVGAGVWISIRLDSTLRLFNAHTFEHLQDVDIEPYVTKMLGTSKPDFAYVCITALLVSNRRLWVGTGTGVIISIPLSSAMEEKVDTKDAKRPAGPGGLVRVYANTKTTDKGESSDGAFIPYCNLTQAQFSFHGHKDSVKFFMAVPGAPNNDEDAEAELGKMLILSGGDGYIDFRVGEENELPPSEVKSDAIRPRDMSHMIVWEMDAELPVLTK